MVITSRQHRAIVDTLTVWAAEFAAGIPSVPRAVYDALASVAADYERRPHPAEEDDEEEDEF